MPIPCVGYDFCFDLERVHDGDFCNQCNFFVVHSSHYHEVLKTSNMIQLLQSNCAGISSGGIAGAASTVAGYPLDTVRVRLQQPHNKYSGLAHGLRTVVRTEVRYMFTGPSPMA